MVSHASFHHPKFKVLRKRPTTFKVLVSRTVALVLLPGVLGYPAIHLPN